MSKREPKARRVTAATTTPESSTDAGGGAVTGISALGLRSYLTAFIILAVLMVAGYVLTLVLPAGVYDRSVIDGVEEVVPGSYHAVDGGLSFWQWLLSPILILGGPNNLTLIMLIVFLLALGGSFYALEQCGVLTYLITRIAHRFESNSRALLFLLPLVFMLMGSMIGSFEETVPLAAIVVALALRMGWDRYQGMGMSILATGCGFAVGIMNPYTVGIAQTIADLPLFSGWSLRAISFVVVYAYLMAFLLLNARKNERLGRSSLSLGGGGINRGGGIGEKSGIGKGSIIGTGSNRVGDSGIKTAGIPGADITNLGEAEAALSTATDAVDARQTRSLRAFVINLLSGIALIITCSVIPAISSLAFVVTALTFLLAGLISVPLAGVSASQLGRWFWAGMKAIAPAILLILMASSIGYVLTEGHVLDTILYYAAAFLTDKPTWLAIIGIYLLVLILEFAIPSGSAKAFLLMPLLAPLADLIDIPRQLAVVAYAFGDGFSNVFYPTNPALLIALSISGLSFGQWFKRTWRFQLGLLLLTCTILVLGLIAGYR
jgi:uncharacterized ion transporter superfamily protein YfcC